MSIATRVYVSKMSAVNALGISLKESWPRIQNGDSAISPVSRFSTERLYCHDAACVDENKLPAATNKICALTAAAVDQLDSVPPDTMVIWTGIKGSSEAIESDDLTTPWRADQFRTWVSTRMGLSNEGYEINTACVAFASGMALASQFISIGFCQNVLVCGADVVSRFTYTGFAAMRAISPGSCMPFDKNRDGLTLGDGAAAILICSESSAAKNRLPLLARISGWGSANDANHITGPSREGSGLSRAIHKALFKSNIDPIAVEAVCAHGTGTQYSDAMELAAMQTIFGERKFPVFSCKGSIGHTLGAAGGIESAYAILAMQQKTAPPTAGLHTPDPGAAGKASPNKQAFGGNNILKTSSGFGGCNCALVFENV